MECFDCHSKNVVRNGNYKVYQKYKCKDCNRQFSERSFSFFCRHRFLDEVISNAILLSQFISSRNVRYFFKQNNVFFSHVTACNWSKKFAARLAKLGNCIEAINYTDVWHVDEKFVKVKGRTCDFSYLWVVEDTNNNIVAVHISDRRDCKGARQVFRKALDTAGFSPAVIVSDGLHGYKRAVKKIFGRKCRHVVRHFESKAIMLNRRLLYLSNNRIESLNSKINLWYKRFRGFKSYESANLWAEGWMYFYNLLRPRINQEEKISWEEVIAAV